MANAKELELTEEEQAVVLSDALDAKKAAIEASKPAAPKLIEYFSNKDLIAVREEKGYKCVKKNGELVTNSSGQILMTKTI